MTKDAQTAQSTQATKATQATREKRSLLKLPVSRMEELLAKISAERALYLPVEANGLLQFGPWKPAANEANEAAGTIGAAGADVVDGAAEVAGAASRPGRLNTAVSPKNFFFPQTETIAAFRIKGKEIAIEENRDPAEPFAIFGVRACDAESLNLLDLVFLSDPADSFYQARRGHGVVITAACAEPEETCFCGAFGIDAAAPGGDIATWIADGVLYWQSRTERGDELTEKVKGLFTQADGGDEAVIRAQQAQTRAALEKLPLGSLKLEGFADAGAGPGVALLDRFNAPLWGELSRACISCGTCTFICPTCHCYDVRDFDTGRGVRRFRCWDSCMCSDFTLMAHGNPRQTQLERFRQRYMHKLVYFPENNGGRFACVGCGRCVTKCPISMNIAKVIKAFGGEPQ